MHIRYFFITNRIKQKEIRVEYYLTGNMIADYFTKCLQSSLFQKFRNMKLGIVEEDIEMCFRDNYNQTLITFGLLMKS